VPPHGVHPRNDAWGRACYVAFYPAVRIEQVLERDVGSWRPRKKAERLRLANESKKVIEGRISVIRND
jgi:hypothetical protein